jgi:hypothetical protein
MQKTIENRQHESITVIFCPDFDMSKGAKEEDGAYHDSSKCHPAVVNKELGTAIAHIQDDCVEHTLHPVEPMIGARADEVAYAIEEPQQRTFAIREIHVWCHPVKPSLTTSIEPGNIIMYPRFKKIRVK